MLANYARIIRRSAAVAAAAAWSWLRSCAALGGTKGLLGAVLGVGAGGVVLRDQRDRGGLRGADEPSGHDGHRAGHVLRQDPRPDLLCRPVLRTRPRSTRRMFGLTVLVCILAWSACAGGLVDAAEDAVRRTGRRTVTRDGHADDRTAQAGRHGQGCRQAGDEQGPARRPRRPGTTTSRAARRRATGWAIMSYLIGGMVLYGGIGWLIGRWTGIRRSASRSGMLLGLRAWSRWPAPVVLAPVPRHRRLRTCTAREERGECTKREGARWPSGAATFQSSAPCGYPGPVPRRLPLQAAFHGRRLRVHQADPARGALRGHCDRFLLDGVRQAEAGAARRSRTSARLGILFVRDQILRPMMGKQG